MGQTRTTNPYKKGTTNYIRTQKEINSITTKPLNNTTPTNALQIINKTTGKTIGYSGSKGTIYTTEQQAVESLGGKLNKTQRITGGDNFGMATPTKTMEKQTISQTLTNQLNKKNITTNNIKTINQDVPTITELGIYNTEKQVTQNYLNTPKTQTTIQKLEKLRFEAEKEARLKTESRATDIYNTDALAQRQMFYREEKQASDQKQVEALNAKIIQFNTNYELFKKDYASKDLDKTTPELELNQKDYEEFTNKNKFFEDQKKSLEQEQQKIQSLFKARTTFQETLEKETDPTIKGLFDPTTINSSGVKAGIQEYQRIETEKEYAGTPAQRAFAGQPKNLITAILATPQIYSEQFKQTGTKKIVSPILKDTKYENLYSYEQPEYTNIFNDKQITDLKAPQTYEEELEFKKQIGLRAGIATAQKPYDIQDLTEDLETFSTDVLIGTRAGATIGTILPGIGTVVGATTGLLTGAVGGATNVITSNIVERQTGSEFLGESLGTITGIGAELISAGAINKAVIKTISANPRLIGNPQSIAYDLGKDKLRVIRYSKFKTGTGFLTRKFDVIDDVIIKRSDLLTNLTKEQTEAIFKQATKAPKYLTDNVIKNRINAGGGKQTTDITKYLGEFTKNTTKKISLNKLLEKLDLTEFSGVQRISVRTGKDLLTKAKKGFKPKIYDDSLESVSGFGQVREAEKAILIKKGTKTFQFEGIGISYSEADKLTETIAKAQKSVKTGVKKITDLKLIGNSKYANLPQKEKVYKLNAKQTTTDLQEDFIFIKGKQKGSRLFTNEADEYSKFLSQTRQKGFSKTITFQGDETIISPTTKFKSDILSFKGTKGEGQIIKTSTKGLPDEYLLKIAGKADDLPKGTEFTKAYTTANKTNDVLGLNQVGLNQTPEIKLLKEAPKTFKSPIINQIPLDKQIDKILSKTTKTITPKISSIPTTRGGTGTLLLTKTQTQTLTKSLTKQAVKNIAKTTTISNVKTGTATLLLTKEATKTLTKPVIKTSTKTSQLLNNKQISVSTQAQAKSNISKFQTTQKIGIKTVTQANTKIINTTDSLTGIKTGTIQTTVIAQANPTTTNTLIGLNTNIKTNIKTKIITKPVIINPMVTPFVRTPPKNIPRIKIPFSQNQSRTRPEKTKLYTAQVRVKNNSKWKNVSQKPQPYNKAYNEGLEVADNTIGQSVRTIYKKTVKKFIPDDPSIKDFKFRNKKYKSKIPSNPVKIELRQFAIDTYGEKNKLSIEKYLAQKKKRFNTNKKFINKKGLRLI